nr:transposon-encoded TnpW family protein [uncultured Oscillibacter sp.]
MSAFQIELTEKQWEIVEDVWEKVKQETAYLATLSKEQRLAWFREHQYPHPISFEREIGGTIYTVNAYFSEDAAETAVGKVNRILNQNITL